MASHAPGDVSGYDRDTARRHWHLALQAIELAAVYRAGLGLCLKARQGPVRDRLVEILGRCGEIHRLTPGIELEALTGGLDREGAFATGKARYRDGLFDRAQGQILLVIGAERLPEDTRAELIRWLDAGRARLTNTALVVLDDSLDDESGVIDTPLGERLALHVQAPDMALADLPDADSPDADLTDAVINDAVINDAASRRSSLPHRPSRCPDAHVETLVRMAERLGITSLRAPIQAVQVARAHAGCSGRGETKEADLQLAAQLTLGPRTTVWSDDDADRRDAARPENEEVDAGSSPPEPPPDHIDESDEPHESTDPSSSSDETAQEIQALEDRLVEAVAAALPGEVLRSIVSREAGRRAARGKDSARQTRHGQRGRPLGVRRARGAIGRERIDLLATLKAAIPWQRLRKAPTHGALAVRRDDLRVRRYRQSSRTTTVFVVDASGSAALHRLAEAKGAVENLLAECYLRRDRVALITFRGQEARLELPPTRSLVRAKRLMRGLPGGGATPLAAGLDLATALVHQIQRCGDQPMVVVMSDARANMSRSGTAGRLEAQSEAEQAARVLATTGSRLLFVDTAVRPRPIAMRLADSMQARYVPLPQLDSARLASAAVPGASPARS